MNSGDGSARRPSRSWWRTGARRRERPEHTLAAYELALQEGADGVECDVRLTRDGHLVCVHDRRVDRTSNGHRTGQRDDTGAAARIGLRRVASQLAARRRPGDTGLLTLDDLVSLVLDWNRPVKIFIETKHPVRYGALVESKVLALLHRYGIASPASADLSRAVVMSFSAAAVWRIRRAARCCPRCCSVRPRAFSAVARPRPSAPPPSGPSIATLREHPELVDRAAAQGRALYCWTVDHYEDVRYCRDVGVAWVATNHPGRTKGWLQNGLTGAGRD